MRTLILCSVLILCVGIVQADTVQQDVELDPRGGGGSRMTNTVNGVSDPGESGELRYDLSLLNYAMCTTVGGVTKELASLLYLTESDSEVGLNTIRMDLRKVADRKFVEVVVNGAGLTTCFVDEAPYCTGNGIPPELSGELDGGVVFIKVYGEQTWRESTGKIKIKHLSSGGGC